jgi:hypothetical protein
MSFKVKVTLDIANEDGTPFFVNHTHWAAMDYEGMVLIEGKLTNVLAELVAFAQDDIAVKAAKAAAAPPTDKGDTATPTFGAGTAGTTGFIA